MERPSVNLTAWLMTAYYQHVNDAGKETLQRDRQVREEIMVLYCDYFRTQD